MLVGAFGCAAAPDVTLGPEKATSSAVTSSADRSAPTTEGRTSTTAPAEPTVVVEDIGARDLGLEVGDCFTGEFITEAPDFVVVDCEEPHDGEVFAFVDHPAPVGAAYPGRAEVANLADQRCAEEFTSYVGGSVRDTSLQIQVAEPLEERWEVVGDRTIICVVTSPGGPLVGSRRGTGAGLPAGEERVVNGLVPGDCYLQPEAERHFTVTVVPCTQLHDREVYAVFDVPPGAYPGDEQIERIGNDRCMAQFADYVGLDFEQSRLSVYWFPPNAQTWMSEDRTFICSLGLNGQRLRESERGAAH
jgi:Septum formation